MSSVSWSASGLGLLSLLMASLIYLGFRKKLFGFLDPLTFFLVTRLAPLLAATALMVTAQAYPNGYFLLMLLSALIFVVTLYVCTPRVRLDPVPCEAGTVRGLFQVAIGLTFLKLVILLTASGPLPIFGASGSDSYIGFDDGNKIGSSFLLAIGSSNVILLSFIAPLARGKTKIVTLLFLVVAALLALAGGKKSSLLMFLVFVAFGEYLRITYVQHQRRYFLRPVLLAVCGMSAVVWAAWVYSRTGVGVEGIGIDSLGFLLDLIFTQWAYPFFLFSSGELSSFFDAYQVDRLRYFFHSILSPLGFPAFSASIGPALHEYQTGELTGNGINPTFVLEGYVIFGMFMPLYAWAVAFAIGRIRRYVLYRKNLRRRVLYAALFLPPIYALPADALLFVKMLLGLVLLLPILHFLVWTTKHAR